MGKWRRIEPAYIKAGDRVKVVSVDGTTLVGEAALTVDGVNVGPYWFAVTATSKNLWYVRKPKPAEDTYYAELEAEVKELKADRGETQAQLDDAMLTIAEQRTELANLRKVLADVQNAAPPTLVPEVDKCDGHGVEYWYNRYVKQLAHSEQLQAANKNRRQKMQLLKKKAKDARRDVDGWAMRYAALAASINELPDEPTPPAPLTRPDEPPVGTFFRVERTGKCYQRGRYDGWPYCNAPSDGHWYAWERITEPGDTITRLELTEVGDKRDADA